MGDDTYRRPRREYGSGETFGEKFNRYMLRKGSEKSMETTYPVLKGPSKKNENIVETTYPKGWKPSSTKKRFGKSLYAGKLERNLGVISAALLGASALFVIPNITGHAIWNLPFGNTNSVGAVLFILGLSGMFFSLRKK